MSKDMTDALAILRRRYGNDAELRQMVEEERTVASVSRAIYDARKHAGISQEELARRINSSPTVIARLEDGEHDGHTVAILGRVARALGLELQIVFAAPNLAESKAPAVA